MNSWTDSSDTRQRSALPKPRQSSEQTERDLASVRPDGNDKSQSEGVFRRFFSRRQQRR